MKTYPDCLPCFINQGLNAVSKLGLSKEAKKEIAVKSLKLLSTFNSFDRNPAYYAYFVQKIVKDITGIKDPFYSLKKKANLKAMEIYDEIVTRKPLSHDDLEWAIKLSAVGNAIDFAIKGDFSIEEEIESLLEKNFTVNHMEDFKNRLSSAGKVMIIGDNAGEIVFDKYLVEVLKDHGKEVAYVVKSKPILNDALFEDAVESGMAEICRVIENGSGKIGTWIEDCGEEFIKEFMSSDIIISKGQANYETLDKIKEKDIFFILQAKCNPIGIENCVKKGDLIFRYIKRHVCVK